MYLFIYLLFFPIHKIIIVNIFSTYIKKKLFVFGCAGSLLLHRGLLQLPRAGAVLCRSARAGVADCNHYRKGPGSPAGRRPRVHGNRPHVEPESRPPALRMEPKPTARKGPLRALCPHASSSQTLSESFLVGRLRLGPPISLSNQSVRGCCGP